MPKKKLASLDAALYSLIGTEIASLRIPEGSGIPSLDDILYDRMGLDSSGREKNSPRNTREDPKTVRSVR